MILIRSIRKYHLLALLVWLMFSFPAFAQEADLTLELVSKNREVAILINTGKFADAERLAIEAVTFGEARGRSTHPEFATLLINLAFAQSSLGRYNAAEKNLKRALTIREGLLGTEHPAVAKALNNLAELYREQGRYTEIEPLYKRALAIMEKSLGKDHPETAPFLNNLAVLYEKLGRQTEAESFRKRSLALDKKSDFSGPNVAVGLINEALGYQAKGQFALAAPLYARAIDMIGTSLGGGHPTFAWAVNNLGGFYVDQGLYNEAEPLFKRSLAIQQKSLGADNPVTARYLRNLAELYIRSGRESEALPYSRQAYVILKDRFSLTGTTGALTEQRANRAAFTHHIDLLAKIKDPLRVSESFEAEQLAQASSVGQVVAQMAARFAAGSGEVGRAIRLRQDTAEAQARADKALIDALGAPPNTINPKLIATLRDQLNNLDKRLEEQSRDMSSRFPKYDALVSPAPVSLSDAQKLLKPEEALLVYLVDVRGVFAWAVREDRAEFQRLNITRSELNKMVAVLREGLDPERNPSLAPYDFKTAKVLHDKIVMPFKATLANASHLIVVSDGALQRLPFTVLVTGEAQGKPQWLSDYYATSLVPSISALRALRTFSKGVPGTEPFIGFGDPLLGGHIGDTRRLLAQTLFTRRGFVRGGIGLADVEVIRKASPLPETADELKSLAATLGASESSLNMRNKATETRAKQLDLSNYRVVAFATHGLMAGELSGDAEPGLILTPPEKATEQDDGYLTASEAAQLKLNADWVLLSACNTDAPDDSGEGLSGLAKGFFYAGAKSLLVSNWSVASEAAVQITTGMLTRYEADPGLGKAEALRLSMQALRRIKRYEHPLFWAPFMVVGEGGR